MNTSIQERHRSLFRVPVYQADLNLDANFDLSTLHDVTPSAVQLDWSQAEIVVGVSDPHGALSDATLTVGGKTTTLVPADITETVPLQSDDNHLTRLTLFGAHPGDAVRADSAFQVTSTLRFSGAERISVLAYGKRVHPAQYILVGIAQIIFYLLLLSISERIGFDAGSYSQGPLQSFCFRPMQVGSSQAAYKRLGR